MFEALARFRHRRFRRELSAYLDEMLSPGGRRALEEHLDGCAACRRELAELRATSAILADLPLAEAPRSFALAAAPQPVVRPRPAARRLEFGLRLATAAAAFALAMVVVGDFTGLPVGEGEKEAAPAARPSFEMHGAEEEIVPSIQEAVPAEGGEGRAFAPYSTVEADEEAAPPEIGYAAPEDSGEEAPTPEAAPRPGVAAPPEGAPTEEPVTPETPYEFVPEEDLVAPEPTPEPPLAEEPTEEPPTPEERAFEWPGVVEERAPSPVETPEPPFAEEPPTEAAVGEEPGVAPDATPEPVFPQEPAMEAIIEKEPPESPEATPAAVAPLESQLWQPEYAQPDGAATPEAIVAEGEGGVSRDDVVRWLEIGLGAGVGILVVSWFVVLRHVRMRAQSQ